MTMEPNRSHLIAFIVGVAGVPFAVGLALALWDRPVGDIVPRVTGALCIVPGLFLLTSRNLFKRDGRVRTALQIRMEHTGQRRMRISGASGILLGVAQFLPDIRVRAAVMLLAVAVTMAGVFKMPRRFFYLEEPAD